MGSRQDKGYEYILVTWGVKIAQFLVELFPPNQSGGKEMLGSQLIGPQGFWFVFFAFWLFIKRSEQGHVKIFDAHGFF